MKRLFRIWRMRAASQRGYTILELMIVSVIVILLTTAFLPFFKMNVKAYTRVRGGKDIVQSARIVMTRMSVQISRLQNVSDIITANSTEFRFYDPDGNQIRYQLDGDQLEEGGQMILDNVSSLSFVYYDRSGNTTTTAGSVWRIQVSITSVVEDTGYMTFTTQIFPRNFAY
ncbi:type II secretion system protein [bacterium]|nr:type II secretion system protein [bacterium]